MKILIAILALAFSCNASAVDVTITLTAGEIARAQAALGKARNLVDVNGAPRVATASEVKQFVIDAMVGVVNDQENAANVKAALAAVPPPAQFAPK